MRPSTRTSYRDYRDAYVNPAIGDTALQDLTPVRPPSPRCPLRAGGVPPTSAPAAAGGLVARR